MNYSQLIEMYPWVDLSLELFKGLAPTIVAVLAIFINNKQAKKRDSENRQNLKSRQLAESKIKVLENMLDKYIELSQLFWKSGTELIEYLSETEVEEREFGRKAFFKSLTAFQFKSQEIFDYFKSVFELYDFKIGCGTAVTDANRFANELIDCCEKYENAYLIKEYNVREQKFDSAAKEIREMTIEVKAWTNVVMNCIGKEIKKLYEQ